MIDLKFNKDILLNHLNYSKFIYAAAIIAAVVFVNLVYTFTTPVMPEENKVDIYSYCGYGDEEKQIEWQNDMLSLLPDDQKEVNIIASSYVEQIAEAIVARIAAREGDIIMLKYDEMNSLMENYAFTPLEDYIDKNAIENAYPEIDWSKYSFEDEEGAEHIYMLPLEGVKGLYEIDSYPVDNCIGVFFYSKNIDSAITCLNYIMEQTEFDGEIPELPNN